MKKVSDTRVALKKFRDKMKENIMKGVNDPYLNLTIEDWWLLLIVELVLIY